MHSNVRIAAGSAHWDGWAPRYLSDRSPPATTPYGSSWIPWDAQESAIPFSGLRSSSEYCTWKASRAARVSTVALDSFSDRLLSLFTMTLCQCALHHGEVGTEWCRPVPHAASSSEYLRQIFCFLFCFCTYFLYFYFSVFSVVRSAVELHAPDILAILEASNPWCASRNEGLTWWLTTGTPASRICCTRGTSKLVRPMRLLKQRHQTLS